VLLRGNFTLPVACLAMMKVRGVSLFFFDLTSVLFRAGILVTINFIVIINFGKLSNN